MTKQARRERARPGRTPDLLYLPERRGHPALPRTRRRFTPGRIRSPAKRLEWSAARRHDERSAMEAAQLGYPADGCGVAVGLRAAEIGTWRHQAAPRSRAALRGRAASDEGEARQSAPRRRGLLCVHIIAGTTAENGMRPFDPSTDIALLGDHIASMSPAPRLLIVDPIVSAVAMDSHKTTCGSPERRPLRLSIARRLSRMQRAG